jgi:hypothetical protein
MSEISDLEKEPNPDDFGIVYDTLSAKIGSQAALYRELMEDYHRIKTHGQGPYPDINELEVLNAAMFTPARFIDGYFSKAIGLYSEGARHAKLKNRRFVALMDTLSAVMPSKVGARFRHAEDRAGVAIAYAKQRAFNAAYRSWLRTQAPKKPPVSGGEGEPSEGES